MDGGSRLDWGGLRAGARGVAGQVLFFVLDDGYKGVCLVIIPSAIKKKVVEGEHIIGATGEI